ncbi:MAG: HAD family hydrolase [Anaerolineales bacterium]|nr:HAD family hydrolase [Anaerolineales bacterium]
MKNPFDLVIFDCDGVLVESEPLANQVYVQLFGEFGYQLDYEETLHEFQGVTIHDRLAASARKFNITPPADFIPAFNQRLAALTETELKVVPGVRDFIESLTMPICVASNGSRNEITQRLRVANLTEHFNGSIFSGLEVPHPKPAPDVYLAAANAFNVPPARCIVIEDSVLGITAAVRAGMKVYGHAAYMPARSLSEAGAIPFANMFELKEMLVTQVV